ncbi:hypothetical protein D3C75_1179170 [compost metagenome]
MLPRAVFSVFISASLLSSPDAARMRLPELSAKPKLPVSSAGSRTAAGMAVDTGAESLGTADWLAAAGADGVTGAACPEAAGDAPG